MNYNYDFDIAAITLYIVILVTFFSHKHVRNTNSKVFLGLLGCCFLTPVMDIIGCEVITRQASEAIVYFVNNFYYLTEQATNFLFLLYVLSMLEMGSKTHIVKKILIVAPFAIVALVIITNPMHGLLFSYIDNVWTYGPFRKVIIGLPIVYFGWAIIFAFVKRVNLAKKDGIIIITIAIINVTARVIQYKLPAFLVHSYAVSVGILLLLLGFQLSGKMLDPETGLANRSYLAEAARKYIYNEVPFTLVMVRIADYDMLTTSYGIEATEKYMRNLAVDIKKICEKSQIYHVNNNCYAITLLKDQEIHADDIKIRIARDLNEPWKINDIEMVSSYYITSVSYPYQCPDRETFLSYITYFTNMQGVRYGIVAAEELQIKDKRREEAVEQAIDRAIKNKIFEVYYQPICRTKTQEYVMAEALVRLNDQELGPISPAEFIPISESNGSIIAVGNIVLEKVCQFISNNNLDELGLHSVEVNLSTTQCLQRNFMTVVRDLTAKYKIDRKYLNFEITETASNCEPAIFTDNLAMLRDDGYHLILDDFGSGYANLQRLVTNDFDVIKFDKEMTQRTCDDYKLHEMVEKMQNMFHSMGAKIVAEGVETKEQYEFLKSIGCDYIQGYYFTKALAEDQFIAFVNEHRK